MDLVLAKMKRILQDIGLLLEHGISDGCGRSYYIRKIIKYDSDFHSTLCLIDEVSAQKSSKPVPEGASLQRVREKSRSAYEDDKVTGGYYYKYIGET